MEQDKKQIITETNNLVIKFFKGINCLIIFNYHNIFKFSYLFNIYNE